MTNNLRERVRPIALKYIDSDMPDVFEVQAARRASAAAAAVAQPAMTVVHSSTQSTPDITSGSDSDSDSESVVEEEPTPRSRIQTRNNNNSSPDDGIVQDNRWPVGTMIASDFDDDVYGGSVTHIHAATTEDVQLWHVMYDDGDQADLDSTEMELARKLYLDHNEISEEHDPFREDDSYSDEYDPLE